MLCKDTQNINNFWVIGINYKKTDASIRGSFAVSNDQYNELLAMAPGYGLKELFILSTCNRTEIYAVSATAQPITDLFFGICTGDATLFSKLAYFKNGTPAIQHLFQVAAGLDSQILGDFEILGQIKMAVKQSKANGCIGSFTERLLNSVIQSSKAVKTHTSLSGGTVSVSFAAVQFIKQNVNDIQNKKIVLLGTGKIGKSTCKNLIHYLGTHNITLINRTFETAATLAADLNLKAVCYESMGHELENADIIIVSTNASEPVILKNDLSTNSRIRLVIDLSVPFNVEKEAGEQKGVTLLNIDTLSKIKDETLESRKAEIPKAINIINEHIAEFKNWCDMRRYAPVLKAVKDKLTAIYIAPSLLDNYEQPKEDTIQNVINVLAVKMRRNNAAGCHYIEAINDFIACHE